MGGENYTTGILQDTVRSTYFLLDQAVNENARAKIVGNPFDDNAVVGLARDVLIAIKGLPEASRQRFDDQRAYALDMIELFRPAPKSHYTTSGKGNRNFILF